MYIMDKFLKCAEKQHPNVNCPFYTIIKIFVPYIEVGKHESWQKDLYSYIKINGCPWRTKHCPLNVPIIDEEVPNA